MAVTISQYISEHLSVYPFSVYICDNISSVTTDVILASAQKFLNFRVVFNTLKTGLLNYLNARSRGLTFRQRASCI